MNASLHWEMPNNYAFEDNFDADFWFDWSERYWAWYSIPISTLYIILVFIGQSYMSTRTAFTLRGPLVVWNVAAALFSIFGAYRDCPVQLEVVARDGLYKSICDNRYVQVKYRTIWCLIFCFSKVPELVDTLFIVLRKQRLIFLHWYHHASVLIFAIFEFSDRAQVARWFSFMNFAVHSLMYSYYAIRAAGYKLPKHISMSVTLAQIVQMILGTYFVVYALVMKLSGERCDISSGRLAFALFMYLSFGVLFTSFFIQSYLKPKPQKEKVK